MPSRNAICIVVDGLRASALGAYGNTWYGMPALDQFAAQSIVAEWMLAGEPELESFYREAWDGVHALRPRKSTACSEALVDALPLPLRLASAGLHQTLVTDDLWLDRHAGQMSVEQHLWDIHWLDTGANRPAQDVADTALGQVFAAAIERYESWQNNRCEGRCQPDGGNLLWLHARGMQGPWDAPEVMRWQLVEEDSMRPPTWVTPPLRETGDDPDQWQEMKIAYAAQTMVLDKCLGALLSALDEMKDPPLVMLIGSRGFALGEHGCAGSECRDLYGELLHVPWLLRLPEVAGEPPPRFTGLTQPFDIAATLLDWFGLEAPGDGHSLLAVGHMPLSTAPFLAGPLFTGRQVVVVRDQAGQQIVRTPAWLLRQMVADDGRLLSPQLYSKPDDRWEVNDVASRCPQVVEGMQAVLADHGRRLMASAALEPFELDSELLL
jgi:hypothetical protein